jgi:hypothetical protein
MAQPPAPKKRRMEIATPAHAAVTRLGRHEVSLQRVLSPGAFHSTRVAVAVSTQGLAGGQPTAAAAHAAASAALQPAANPRCLCAISTPELQALLTSDAAQYEAFVASGRRVYSVSVPRAPGAAFQGEQGKGGVYIAEAGEGIQAEALEAIQHRAEVQHLALYEQGGGDSGGDATAVLASVDCYGRAVLAQARRLEGQPGLHITGAHQLQPPDVLRCVGGRGDSMGQGC